VAGGRFQAFHLILYPSPFTSLPSPKLYQSFIESRGSPDVSLSKAVHYKNMRDVGARKNKT